MAGDDRERRPVARPALVVHEGGKDQPQPATPIGRPFGTRAAQGAFVAATLANARSNQALLGALKGQVDLDDPLLVRLGKGEGGVGPELSPYAPVEQQASNQPESVKAADKLKKHADDLGAGLYRPAGGVADQRAALKARQEQLEGEIAALSGEMVSEQERIADLDEDIGEKQTAADAARGALGKRQAHLQGQVARAQAKGKNPPDVERDGQIRDHKRDLAEIPDQIDDLRGDQAELGEEIAAESSQQQEKQEELGKIAEQLAALQPKGGGGGAPAAAGPPREVDPVKTGAKVAAALDAKKTKVERDLSKLKTEGDALKAKLEKLALDIPAKKTAIDSAQSALESARSKVASAEGEEEIAAAKRARTAAEGKLIALKAELRRLEDEEKKAKKAAEENAEKAKAAEEEKEKLEGDIEQMRSVGCEAWQMCADAYGIKVQPVYLPPGVHPDDTPEMQKFRAEAEAKKKAAEEADPNYVPPGEDEKAASDPEKEKEKEEQKERAEREALLAKVAAAQDLPEAQREATLQRLATETGKDAGELVREHRDAVKSAEDKVQAKAKDLLSAKDVAAFAKENGLSAAEAALLQRDLKRRQFEARAADALGVQPGDEAGAKKAAEDLRKKAHARGMAPDVLLTHVAALPEADVPAELKSLRDGAVRTQTGPIDEKAIEDAQRREKRYTAEKDLAEKLGVRPEDARRYIEGLASGEGGSEEKALEKLQAAPDAKALQELVGSTMKAVADDTGMYGDKTVASEGLQAELDRIQALPPHERYAAIKALKQVTGQDINTLISSGRRGKRRDEALASAAEVAYDVNATSDERKQRMAELAERYHLSAEALEKALTKRTDNVAAKVGKENVEKLADPALDPKKRAELVEKLRKSGVPSAHLDQLAALQEQKAAHARWKKALGLEPDQVITEAKRRQMKPEELLEHVRTCPESELPEGLRKAKAELAKWDRGDGKKLLDAKKDADRKAREDARLRDGEKAEAVAFDDPSYKARKQALLDELNSAHVDDDEAKKLLMQMTPAERAALLREGVHDEEGRPLFGPNGSFQDGVGDTADVEKLMAEAAAYNKVLAAQPKQEEAAKKAAQVEKDLTATVAVAEKLGCSEDEARLHLKVLAATNGGKPLSEAAKQLDVPGKTAKDVLKDVYTQGGVNGALRLQLALVKTLPPEARAKALEGLRGITGLDAKHFGAVRREVARQERIQSDVAALARLPADVRAKELERLAKLHGVDAAELEGVAAQATAADESLLRGSGAGAAVDRFVNDLESSLDPKDVQAKAKEIAQASGLPVETVLAAIDRRRLARAEASATKALGPEGVSRLQREAALRGMTLEELQNYLLKVSPADLADDDLRKMRSALEASGAKVRWSEKEKQDQAKAGLRLDPNGPDYAKYVEKRGKLMGLLDGSQNDDDILAAFRAMTPAERRQLLAEQGEAALRDKLEGAMELGDENEAKGLLASSKADPLEAYAPIDPKSPEYVEAREAIVAELSNGIEDADADDVKERLAKLPPGARAQLLRDLGALQKQLEARNATSTGDSDDDEETIPCTDLESLFADDPEARAWVADAKRASTVFASRADLAKTVEQRAELTSGAMKALGVSDPAVAWSLVTATGTQLGLTPKQSLAFLKGEKIVPDEEIPEWIRETVDQTLAKIDDVAGIPSKPTPVQVEDLDDDELDAWVRKASPKEIAEMDTKLGGKLRERLAERDSIEARGSLARLRDFEKQAAAPEVPQPAAPKTLKELLSAGSDAGLMSPVLQAQWAAIERLPPSQREQLQGEIAGLMGKPVAELRETAARSAQNLGSAQKVAQLDSLSPEERQAALEKLAAEIGSTQDQLLMLRDQALAAGLIEVPGAAKAAAATLDADQKRAEELQRVLDDGDEDKIKALIGKYKGKPDELKRALDLYGGRDKLKDALDSEFNLFGEDDPDYVDLLAVVDVADGWQGGDDEGAKAANHALQVGIDAARFEAELDDAGGINDARIRDLLKETPPERLADVKARLAERGFDPDQALADGVDEKIYADYRAGLELGAAIAGLPAEEAAAKRTEMRVAYKSEQLKAELALGQDADKDRLRDLLGDCDDVELERIAEAFDADGLDLRGQLDEALKPESKVWGYLAGVAVGVVLFPFGAGAVAAGIAVANAVNDQADPSLVRIQMKVRDAAEDPADALKADGFKVALAYDELKTQLSGWTTDGAVLDTLKSLNPAELVALKEQFEKDNPGKTFAQIMGDDLDGDELAVALGAMQNAEDAVSGVDRRKELRQGLLEVVRSDRFRQLENDPKHAGKSPAELWKLVEAEGPQLEKQAAERHKKITESAQALFDAMDGWGDDEEALNRTLAGLSPAEAELVKVEYRRHFGRDLDAQLSQELGTDDLARARGLMSQEGRTEALRSYALSFTEGVSEDEEGLFAALEGMSAEERAAIADGPKGAAFFATLTRDLGDNERILVEALTERDPETGLAQPNAAHVAAAKVNLHLHGSGDWDVWSGWGTKEEELVSELDELTPEQVAEAERWFDENVASGGDSFRAALADDLGTDAEEWKIVEAELRGDKVSADVHRLRWAAQDDGEKWITVGLAFLFFPISSIPLLLASAAKAADLEIGFIDTTDDDLIEKTLSAAAEGRGGRGPDHLKKVLGAFDAIYGREGGKYGGQGSAFDAFLQGETSGMQREYFRQIAEKGQADDELVLLYALEGAGTDETKARKVLEKLYAKSPAEREAFARRFEALAADLLGSTQSLEAWVDEDFGGAEALEMKLLVEGPPTTPEAKLRVAQLRWEFERGGISDRLFGNGIMDALEDLGAHHRGSLLAQETAEIYAMFDAGGTFVGDEERLEELVQWQTGDQKSYRAARDQVADAVSTTVQVVGGIVLAVVPGGQGASAALILSLMAAAAKAAIKGGGYSMEEASVDVANALVAAATAGLGKALDGVKLLGNGLTAQIVKQMIEGGVEGFLNAALSSEQAFAEGDFAAFSHILKGAVGGAVKSGAMAGLGDAMGKTNLGQRLKILEDVPTKGSFAEQFTLKYLDEVIKGAAGSALDLQQLEAWANGKGLDAQLFKTIFIDSAVQAAGETTLNRSPTIQRMKRGQLVNEDEAFAQAANIEAAAAAHAELVAKKRREQQEQAAQQPQGEQDVAAAEQQAAIVVAVVQQHAAQVAREAAKPKEPLSEPTPKPIALTEADKKVLAAEKQAHDEARREETVGRASVPAHGTEARATDAEPAPVAVEPKVRKAVAEVLDLDHVDELRASYGGAEDGDEHAIRQRDALERIVAGPDGEIAARALALLEIAGERGTKRLLEALDRAAAHSDPDAAAAALDAEIRQIELVDEIATQREFTRANQRLVEEARAALKKDPNAKLSPAHAQALLDDAVGFARKQHMTEYGKGVTEGFTPDMLGGICTITQGRVDKQLREAGVTEVIRHATHADDSDVGPDGKLLPKPFEDASGHYFLVVKMPDGNHYLIDPTFGQFLNNKGSSDDLADKASQVGHRMVETEAGRAVAKALTSDGYVRLTEETAAIYARSLSGKDGLGLPELLTASQARVVGEKTRAVGDDPEAAYAALPEREAPVVPSPLAPAGAGRKPEDLGPDAARYARETSKKYLAAVDDFDSADAPERRKAAEREIALLATIGRIQDPELAQAAFAMLRGGGPEVHEELHRILDGAERTARSNPGRATDRLRDGLSALRQSEGGRRAESRNEIRESTRRIGELTEKAFAPGTDPSTREHLLKQARDEMDGIRAIRAAYGDAAAEVDTESPAALLDGAGQRWSDAKAAYDQDGETHKLWALVYFRKEVVDGILDEVEAELKALGKPFRRESLGSTNRTSDYDLSADGLGDAEAVKRFNQKFRERFGAESGDVFDTNVYTQGEYASRNVGGQHVARQEIRSGKAQEKDDERQSAFALAKTRKHLDDEQWRALREGVEAASAGDAEGAARFAREAAEAEALHQQAQDRVRERMKEIAGPEADTADPELELQAKNQLYGESVERVRSLTERKARYAAELDADPANWTDAQKLRMDAYALRIRQAQGEALMFAHEAYFSEGAIRHVVEKTQGGKDVALSKQQALSSFNEQLGDAFKDFHHYGEDFGTCAFRSSKYLDRMLSAAAELGVPVEGPGGSDVQGAVKQLVAIRKADAEPFKSMSPQDRAAKSVEILAAAGIGSPEALKQWVIETGVKVNRAAKATPDLAKEALDRSSGDFKAAWTTAKGPEKAALADHREDAVKRLLADVGVSVGDDESCFHHINDQFAALYLPEGELAVLKAKHGPALEALGVRAIDKRAYTEAFDGFIDDLVGKSPALMQVLQKIKADGWTIQSGTSGLGGGHADRDKKEIQLHGDPNDPRLMLHYVGLLAHEVGHADYKPVFRDVGTISKLDEASLRWLVEPHMLDEAHAARAQLVVRDQILAAGGPDIGMGGKYAYYHIQAWEQYKRDGDTSRLFATLTNTYYAEALGAGTYYDVYAAHYRAVGSARGIPAAGPEARQGPMLQHERRAADALAKHGGEFKVAWVVAKGAEKAALAEHREAAVRRMLADVGVAVGEDDTCFSHISDQFAAMYLPVDQLADLKARYGAELDALGVRAIDKRAQTEVFDGFVDDLVGRSPFLMDLIEDLRGDDWKLKIGTKTGHGGEADRFAKELRVDDKGGDPDFIHQVVRVLAHEGGHAVHDPHFRDVSMVAKVDDPALRWLVRPHMIDEAHAAASLLFVREEILANGGPDIRLAVGKEREHLAAWEQYRADGDFEKLIATLANHYFGEPLGDTTYFDYYADYYREKGRQKGLPAMGAQAELGQDGLPVRTVLGVNGPIEVADDAPDLGRAPRARQVERPVAPMAAPYPPTVDRVGKRYPRNGRYAGTPFPLEPALAAKYPQGVRFNPKGFPDFSPHVHVLADGSRAEVQILYTGSRAGDFREANAAVGLAKEPDGWTWHHHEDGTTMQLVPTDLHDAVPHTGGYAVDKAR